MCKYILLLIYLFSTSLSTYRPWSQKSIDFGDDNICRQTENIGFISIDYVRNCPEGKYCDLTDNSAVSSSSSSSPFITTNNLFTCKPYTQLLNTFNSYCEDNSHCDGSLECINNKCSLDSSTHIFYTKTDSLYASSPGGVLTKHYCTENKYYYKSNEASTLSYGCYDLPSGISQDTYNTYSYYINGNKEYAFEPGFGKVDGEISFRDRASNADYIQGNIKTALIGSVETGKFVGNYLACQSGFALESYGNKKITEDGASYLSNTFSYCVDVLEVEDIPTSSSTPICRVKYSVDGIENIVDSNKYSLDPIDCSYLMTKIEIFKNYSEQLKNLYNECEEKKTYEEPFTCRNDELRKWWYFYAHPDEYILYKDKKEIRNYLLQSHYRNYALDLISGFLNINYFILLLILILL